jgi:hypothetical protein
LFKTDNRGRFIINDNDMQASSAPAVAQHFDEDEAIPFGDLVDSEATKRFKRRKRTASTANLDNMDEEESAIAQQQQQQSASKTAANQAGRKRQRTREDDETVGGLGVHTGREFRAKKVCRETKRERERERERERGIKK